jgi:transposase
MIQLAPQMRILLAVAPVDFRCGIDGLARVCRDVLQADPFSGAAFIFRNRRATAIKILLYDSQGFWLMHKRLSAQRFVWWPSGEEQAKRLEVAELQVLLWNGDPAGAKTAPPWRRVNVGS